MKYKEIFISRLGNSIEYYYFLIFGFFASYFANEVEKILGDLTRLIASTLINIENKQFLLELFILSIIVLVYLLINHAGTLINQEIKNKNFRLDTINTRNLIN